MATFNKPAKNSLELITEWEQRGSIICDKLKAKHYLDFISYYRLSAYAIPFQDVQSANRHLFQINTCFDDILNLYVFDRELRLLIMDAIERVEVAIRAQICNVHSLWQENNQPYGAFWYLEERHFLYKFPHFRFLSNIERQLSEEKKKLDKDIDGIKKRKSLNEQQQKTLIENAQKENFIRHYLSCYDNPKLPPCWMVVEMLTWGELSHLYAGLRSSAIKKRIATNLGVNAEILESWLKALNSVRNICAHHSRLWNKELGIAIKIPTSSQIKWLSKTPNLNNIKFERRIYSMLVALQTLLYVISPDSEWAKRLKELTNKYPNISYTHMGMPMDWDKDEFWQNALE